MAAVLGKSKSKTNPAVKKKAGAAKPKKVAKKKK
jgi:hypothetical protein